MWPGGEEKGGGDKEEDEDAYRKEPGGDQVDAGEAEDYRFEQRPDGKSGGRVEVSGDIPVASLEVADGGITVPTLGGVLGPVPPGGVVRKVCVDMEGVKNDEGCGDEEKGKFRSPMSDTRCVRACGTE